MKSKISGLIMQINTFSEHKKKQNSQKIHDSCGFEIYETFAYLTDFPVKLTLKVSVIRVFLVRIFRIRKEYGEIRSRSD